MKKHGISTSIGHMMRIPATALLLTLPTNILSAETSETAIIRTDTGQPVSVSLVGDSQPTTVTANWEIEQSNKDGNQNQASLAISGEYVYLCIDYFDQIDDRPGNLFLRRFSKTDGTYDEISIALPSHLKSGANNFHSIFTDSDGELCVAFLTYTDETNSQAIITLCRLNQEEYGNMSLDIDNSVSITIYDLPLKLEPTLHTVNLWMGNIIGFTGDIAGDFSFDVMIDANPNTTTYRTYQYRLYHISSDASQDIDMSYKLFDIATNYPQSNFAPDISPIPNSDGLYMVTYSPVPNNQVPIIRYYPVLYKDGVLIDDQIMKESDTENCRGFYSFTHNGHVLSVYAAHHNETEGSVFNLVEWNADYSGISNICTIPEKPFPFNSTDNPVYYWFYRQVAIAVPNYTKESGVSTDLYVCSPGCGIASYTITTPGTTTGVDNNVTDATKPYMELHGKTLVFGNATKDSQVIISDIAGHTVMTYSTSTGTADLDALSPGVYVAHIGSESLKIYLR